MIVFSGNLLASVFNLSYHLVSVRILSPEDYGALNALLSLSMLFLFIMPTLRIPLMRYFTEYITRNDFSVLIATFLKIAKRMLLGAFLVCIVFFILSPLTAQFLKVRITFVSICGVAISLAIVSNVFSSLFQSLQKFHFCTSAWVIASLVKLVCGSVLMLLGWKILGGLLGVLAGSIAFLLASLCFFPATLPHLDINKKSFAEVDLTPIYKYFIPTFVALLSFAVLTNIDVILVRHFFSSLDAGHYSVAQTAGKISFFLPYAFAVVLFPKSTKSFIAGEQSLKLLYKALFLGGLCCFFITTIYFVFPDLVIKMLTSKVNPVSSSIVGLFSLTMSFYALLWIIISFLLATHNLRFVWYLLCIVIAETVIIFNYHSTLRAVLYVALGFSIFSFAGSLTMLNLQEKGKS